jgi:hypothetical protein
MSTHTINKQTITDYSELPVELQQYFDDAKLREFYKLGVDREISMQVLQDYLVELYNRSLEFPDDTLVHKIVTFTLCFKASIANGRFNKANSVRTHTLKTGTLAQSLGTDKGGLAPPVLDVTPILSSLKVDGEFNMNGNGYRKTVTTEPVITIPISTLNVFVGKCIEEIANYSSLHFSQVEIVIDSLEAEYADLIRVYQS